MNASPLSITRDTNHTTPSPGILPNTDLFTLKTGRVHEVCGAARVRFALWLAAQTHGPIMWISPDWGTETLNPCGAVHLIDPARILHVTTRHSDDTLWGMEEALRAGAVSTIIAELTTLPTLTQVRRMHLAAEAGVRAGAGVAPLGLLLTPGDGGAPGVETRWHLHPDHSGQPGRWLLRRLRARTAPQAEWSLVQNIGQHIPHVQRPPSKTTHSVE